MRVCAVVASALILMVPVAAPAQDVTAGQAMFLQCRVCHQVGDTAKNGVGPVLNGLFGRHSGSVEGYAYSPALTKSGLVWDAKTLDRWLARPSSTVPGSRMFYIVNNPAHRADLIAYLAGTKR